MLLYVLICLCLSLTGVAGLQMIYMFYLEAIDKQRRQHLKDLQKEARSLKHRLTSAEQKIAEQESVLERAGLANDETWAEVIEEVNP